MMHAISFLYPVSQHGNHRRQQFGDLCILWFGKPVVSNSVVKNEDPVLFQYTLKFVGELGAVGKAIVQVISIEKELSPASFCAVTAK